MIDILSDLPTLIGALAALGSGIVCGFYLTFSAAAIRGFDDLGVPGAVRAMQAVNITVVRPPLMIALFGTGLLGIALIIMQATDPDPRSGWLISDSVVYLIGSLVLTMAFHIPRNNALAALDPDSPEAVEGWRRYVREWLPGNHVRTVSTAVSTLLLIIGLLQG